jgi:hypothetical protein
VKKTALIAAAIMIAGCAAAGKTMRSQNPRIVYRDLTRPVTYKVPPVAPEPAKSAAEQGRAPQYFVAFANESYTKFDPAGLAGLAGHARKADLIVIVGHSHGNSAAGTLRLASRRAETIKDYLKHRGYPKSLVMASWGSQISDYAPSRGVHLYVIKKAEKETGLPIIIAKEVKPAKKTTDFDLASQDGSIAHHQPFSPRKADGGGV